MSNYKFEYEMRKGEIMSEQLGKRTIERACRTAGYSISEAKAFVGRLPRAWFDNSGHVIPGVLEKYYDTEIAASGPVDRVASLLKRAEVYVR